MASLLPQSTGYFILVGIGLLFAFVVTLLIKAETRWLGTKKTSYWFFTAGGNVKTGLVASSIVSTWTWAATLLQSSTVAYQFGISGPFWYAAGASIQILLFATMATRLKKAYSNVHTFPEIIYERFGKKAHKVFLFFGLMTNIIITSMLVLGGAAAVNSLTGVNLHVAAFLIPIGIVIYTIIGGLKATFIADYINTSFLFIVILIFVVGIYFTSSETGGITGIYDKLLSVTLTQPVEGNSNGSYLTLASVGGLIFGIVNIVGNFGTVFVNQAFWQRAIAADPRTAGRSFLLGGMIWFAVPMMLATTLGLTAVAMGLTFSEEQISLGLVAPFTAFKLLGDTGAILLLTVLFTVVISAGSAQITSVTSLVTFDIFKRYLKPSFKDAEVIVYSRAVILVYGLAMGVFASILFQIGVGLEYVYLVMGILTGSAVAPIILTLVWKKTKGNSMTVAAIAGIIGGTMSWIISASLLYGDISLKSTGEQIPLLVGNVTSISLGAIVTILGSSIERSAYKKGNKQIQHVNSPDIDQKGDSNISPLDEEINQKQLSKESKTLFKYAIVLVLVFTVFFPLPLYFSGYVFSSISLHIWIWTVIAWTSIAGGIMIAFPVIESRNYIIHVTRNSIIPLVFIGITLSTIFTSSILYLHYSDQERYIMQLIGKGTLIKEDTVFTVIHLFKEQMYTSFVLVYIIIGVMGAFSLTTLLLNRRSRKLVELTKIQKKEIEKVNEELVKLGRVKEEFINTAAHELRTPIQPIMGLVYILSNRIKDNEQKKYLDSIKRNAERLRKLANDILDVSKIDSGQLHLDKHPFDMNEAIVKIIFESQDQYKDKEIKINFVKMLEEKELFVVADKEQIARVLFNLLSNAIKFTDKGDIIITIEKINSNKTNGIHEIQEIVQVDEINYIIVKIKDFGIGIHSEIMPRLFSKFASKSFQGTGLGLYLSKSIIEAHGGNIWAENNKNEKGATFSFSLPLRD